MHSGAGEPGLRVPSPAYRLLHFPINPEFCRIQMNDLIHGNI